MAHRHVIFYSSLLQEDIIPTDKIAGKFVTPCFNCTLGETSLQAMMSSRITSNRRKRCVFSYTFSNCFLFRGGRFKLKMPCSTQSEGLQTQYNETKHSTGCPSRSFPQTIFQEHSSDRLYDDFIPVANYFDETYCPNCGTATKLHCNANKGPTMSVRAGIIYFSK